MAEQNIFARTDPAVARSERAYTALVHLVGRHAQTAERRTRHAHPEMPSSDEMVKLMAVMAGGGVAPEPDEPDIDAVDLVAALTLIPQTRAELDNTELALLKAARRQGMTWQEIAFALGLGTPQAARQRYDRLEARTDDGKPPASKGG
jgi:predicted ArsR family transcriptional regulator